MSVTRGEKQGFDAATGDDVEGLQILLVRALDPIVRMRVCSVGRMR